MGRDLPPARSSSFRLTSREAVALALEQLAAAHRAGHVVSFSIHCDSSGQTRIAANYVGDCLPIEVEDS